MSLDMRLGVRKRFVEILHAKREAIRKQNWQVSKKQTWEAVEPSRGPSFRPWLIWLWVGLGISAGLSEKILLFHTWANIVFSHKHSESSALNCILSEASERFYRRSYCCFILGLIFSSAINTASFLQLISGSLRLQNFSTGEVTAVSNGNHVHVCSIPRKVCCKYSGRILSERHSLLDLGGQRYEHADI